MKYIKQKRDYIEEQIHRRYFLIKREFTVVDISDGVGYICLGTVNNRSKALGKAFDYINQIITSDDSDGTLKSIKEDENCEYITVVSAETDLHDSYATHLAIMHHDSIMKELTEEQVKKYRYTHPEYFKDTNISQQELLEL